jgi:hypothetical protein
MPKHRKIQPFFLFLVDDENRIFNIIGPITNDTDWINKIFELQETGRKVRCFSAGIDKSIDMLSKSYSEQTGYTFSHVLIAEEPEDRSFEYRGILPQYAKSADRKKVVKILCKGKCMTSSWAEMNVNYPGKEMLRKSNVGDYIAKCLKCGQIAQDSYNWFR